MGYNDFTEMPVWQTALEIVKEIYKITEQLPKTEDYALCGQLRRAAVSITGNISEGFGRGHKKDKINFYFFARGSAFEVRSHLMAGKEVGYFTKENIVIIDHKLKTVVEELNKIIKGLNAYSQS